MTFHQFPFIIHSYMYRMTRFLSIHMYHLSNSLDKNKFWILFKIEWDTKRNFLLHLFFSWLEFKNRTKGIIINSRVYYLITHIHNTTLNCVRGKESDEQEENWDEKFSFLLLDSFFFMFQCGCDDFVSIWYAGILFLRWSMLF